MEHSLISLWSEYEKFSIIDTGSMLKTIMPNLRKEVRKIHTQNYAITPPATEKSRWQAYLTVRRWTDSFLAKLTCSYGLCSKCKVLG